MNQDIAGSIPTESQIFCNFFQFHFFKLAITSSGELGGTPNFYIVIYMPIGSCHINEKFGLSRALFPILLSKITKISPKNLTFLPIKFDRVITDNF